MSASRLICRIAPIAWILLGASFCTGCYCGGHGPAAWCAPGDPPCFGFNSTCWNPWPGDCSPCPAFSLPAQGPEGLPVPTSPIQPTPMKDEETPPAATSPPGEPQSWVPAPPELRMAPVVSPTSYWRVNSPQSGR